MATKIQPAHAIRIALDLKKRLVDRNLLTITQSQLEHELFLLMKRWGYGELNVRWYRMLSSFHHHRIPLILLIGGTKCLGKAALATQLAERLNLTGVLRTEVIAELMESIMNTDDVGIKKKPVWLRKFKTDHDFMEAWKQECQLVRRGLHADLTKCLKEGKSIIIVGSHVNHELINYVQQLISSECVSNDSATPAALADRKATDHLQPLPQYTKGILIPFLITLEDEQLHRQFVADFVDLMQDFRIKEWSFEGCDGSESDETGQSYSRHTEVEQLYHRFRLIQDSLFSKSPKLKVLSSTVTLSPLSAETPKTSTLSHSSSTIQAAEKPSSKPQFLPALIPLNVRSSLITIDFMHTKVLEHLSSVFDSSPLSRPQSTPVRPHAQSLSHSVNIPRNSSKLTTGFTAPLTQDPSSRFHFPVKSMSSNEVNGMSTMATVHSVSSKNGDMEIVVPRVSGVTRRNTDFLPKTKSKT
ncbi:hypothetical protein BKA69DRAFT_1085938 [Paraphysoderma sedebokerense]|nr:hypothetical protein BKA69DRAFT_1085938 [Paraphysoderma sedebokerense]